MGRRSSESRMGLGVGVVSGEHQRHLNQGCPAGQGAEVASRPDKGVSECWGLSCPFLSTKRILSPPRSADSEPCLSLQGPSSPCSQLLFWTGHSSGASKPGSHCWSCWTGAEGLPDSRLSTASRCLRPHGRHHPWYLLWRKGRWVRVKGQLDNSGSSNELIQVTWGWSYQIVQREARKECLKGGRKNGRKEGRRKKEGRKDVVIKCFSLFPPLVFSKIFYLPPVPNCITWAQGSQVPE